MSATASIRFEQPAYILATGAEARSAVAQTLVARLGEWGLLGTWTNPGSIRQTAYCIRRGLSGWQMFGPGFEAEAVTMFGEHRLYARYVGMAAKAKEEQP